MYLFETEVYQDLVVCLRRNNPQEGGEEAWNWKSITNGLWVEKGADPGQKGPDVTDYSNKKGIPECTSALEGEVREFKEDRKFRSFPVKCGRDENGTFTWKSGSSIPVFFRTTLPDCSEKLHGMNAVLDEGLNSQSIVCLRYQGQMKWVNPGKREPVQFHRQDPPLTKKQFLDSKSAVKPFEEENKSTQGMGGSDFVGKAAKDVLTTTAKAIPMVGQMSPMATALRAANILPVAFDGTQLLSDIAKAVIVNNGNVDIDNLVSQISSAFNSNGIIDDATTAVLSTLGGIGDQIVRGVERNTVPDALQNIGQRALNQSIRALSPEASSVYFAYMAGGIAGALDAAAALNLPQIPEEIADVIRPALAVGASVLRTQPQSINNLVVGAVGGGGGTKAIPESINALVSVVSDPAVAEGIGSIIAQGGLGEIAQTLRAFSDLPSVAGLIEGVSGVPKLASTALQLVGLGEQFSSLLGGGLTLDGVSQLLGTDAVSGLIGGFLGGLGGIGGGECPCDPKCRKTKHSEDSDGNVLLEKCGNVIANSHSSYAPEGNPLKNNENEVAKILDLIPTFLGNELCIRNELDLTQMIQNIKRLGEMADRLESAKNADWPELWLEMMYTFETVEKAFKQTDNNITKVESVERKLLDAQFRLINKLMVGKRGFFPRALVSITDSSKAIRDLYKYVQRLDWKKKGGKVGVRPTTALNSTFKNITRIPALNVESKVEAEYITGNFLRTGDKEWKSMEPGGGLVDLKDFVLGLIPVDLPQVFDCKTKRNKAKVLKDSLESKINSPTPAQPESVFSAKLPSNLADSPEVSSLLDQITYHQGRADRGEAEC
jgi:hypothetical protein